MLVGDPGAWGKGVAREAERQACNRAFATYEAHRIHAEIPATNEAAQKVVTYLGFRARESCARRSAAAAEAVDNQVWGLLPEDFTGWEDGRATAATSRSSPTEATAGVGARRLLPLAALPAAPRASTHTLRIESDDAHGRWCR